MKDIAVTFSIDNNLNIIFFFHQFYMLGKCCEYTLTFVYIRGFRNYMNLHDKKLPPFFNDHSDEKEYEYPDSKDDQSAFSPADFS